MYWRGRSHRAIVTKLCTRRNEVKSSSKWMPCNCPTIPIRKHFRSACDLLRINVTNGGGTKWKPTGIVLCDRRQWLELLEQPLNALIPVDLGTKPVNSIRIEPSAQYRRTLLMSRIQWPLARLWNWALATRIVEPAPISDVDGVQQRRPLRRPHDDWDVWL